MYEVLGRHTYVEEIKKSRFIATATPVASADEALKLIREIGDPAATHNCWAYKIGDIYRFSDDGEPGGTAGRPILGAIGAKEFDRVLVVVTRFFGGIKLGAGGLARAYGGTAAKCLNEAPKREIELKTVIKIAISFSDTGVVYSLIEQADAEKIDEAYDESGVSLTVEIRATALDGFLTSLKNATKGRAKQLERKVAAE